VSHRPRESAHPEFWVPGAEPSREFLLAAACCRWPPHRSREAAIRNAASRVDDWDSFVRLASRHRVIGFVGDALGGIVDLPTPAADELTRRKAQIARQNFRFAAELARLQNAFDAAQLPVLVLKGLALAKLAFGDYQLKQARDLDLLVPLASVERAVLLLEQVGYILDFPARRLSQADLDALPRYSKEIGLFHPQRRFHVELHWRLAYNLELLKDVDAFSRPQKVALSSAINVFTLPSNDLVAYLCVHGAYHGWSRLKWLADLNALIASGASDITLLYRHAQACGAGLCAGQALILCSRLFGLQLPAELAEKLCRNGRISKLTKIAVSAMTRPEIGRDDGIRVVLGNVRLQFLIGNGWKFFQQQCRLMAVGVIDVVELPLPLPLHFLYPLLRLPLWLGRRIFGRAHK
jgi:Uncharacterised nucleotidyltransferase